MPYAFLILLTHLEGDTPKAKELCEKSRYALDMENTNGQKALVEGWFSRNHQKAVLTHMDPNLKIVMQFISDLDNPITTSVLERFIKNLESKEGNFHINYLLVSEMVERLYRENKIHTHVSLYWKMLILMMRETIGTLGMPKGHEKIWGEGDEEGAFTYQMSLSHTNRQEDNQNFETSTPYLLQLHHYYTLPLIIANSEKFNSVFDLAYDLDENLNPETQTVNEPLCVAALSNCFLNNKREKLAEILRLIEVHFSHFSPQFLQYVSFLISRYQIETTLPLSLHNYGLLLQKAKDSPNPKAFARALFPLEEEESEWVSSQFDRATPLHELLSLALDIPLGTRPEERAHFSLRVRETQFLSFTIPVEYTTETGFLGYCNLIYGLRANTNFADWLLLLENNPPPDLFHLDSPVSSEGRVWKFSNREVLHYPFRQYWYHAKKLAEKMIDYSEKVRDESCQYSKNQEFLNFVQNDPMILAWIKKGFTKKEVENAVSLSKKQLETFLGELEEKRKHHLEIEELKKTSQKLPMPELAARIIEKVRQKESADVYLTSKEEALELMNLLFEIARTELQDEWIKDHLELEMRMGSLKPNHTRYDNLYGKEMALIGKFHGPEEHVWGKGPRHMHYNAAVLFNNSLVNLHLYFPHN